METMHNTPTYIGGQCYHCPQVYSCIKYHIGRPYTQNLPKNMFVCIIY